MNWLPWRRGELTISLWHEFRPPPWGGGNQFMLALRKALLEEGVRVRESAIGLQVDAYVLHANKFDVTKLRRAWKLHRLLIRSPRPVIHRVDGPVCIYRADGSGRDIDDQVFALNAEFATVTVLQSRWSLEANLALGYSPVNPVVIPNACDPHIFHTRGRIPFSCDRRIRLISVSWSANPNKGAAVYQWLDKHLDFSRFEYTFVGNAPVSFERIRSIPPQPSERVADLLRQHDIFVIASRNDPCSNSLVEALTCGLPALYLESGGHPEIVSNGGLPFRSNDEVIPQLERLMADYEEFQRQIRVHTIHEIAKRYLALVKDVK